jgi:hypothetical protein
MTPGSGVAILLVILAAFLAHHFTLKAFITSLFQERIVKIEKRQDEHSTGQHQLQVDVAGIKGICYERRTRDRSCAPKHDPIEPFVHANRMKAAE